MIQIIGYFNVNYDLNEAAIGKSVPNTKFQVYVEGKEGTIPHMHICDKNDSNKKVLIRIKLETNQYFRESSDTLKSLNTSERRALDKFLSSPSIKDENLSYWQYACKIWNDNNKEHLIKDFSREKQPSYRQIKD